MLVAEEVRTGARTLALVSARKVPGAKNAKELLPSVLLNVRNDAGAEPIIVNAPQHDNPDIRYSKDGRILAFVKDGKVYLVADAIDQKTDSVPGLLRHEVGVHALRLNRVDAAFQGLLRDLEKMRDAGDAQAKAAFDAVPTDTDAALVTEDALGYLVERHPELSISQRFVAWLKNAIRNLAGKLKGSERLRWVDWANRLTPEDLTWMAGKALKTATERLAQSRRDGAKGVPLFSKKTDEELAQSAAERVTDPGETQDRVAADLAEHDPWSDPI